MKYAVVKLENSHMGTMEINVHPDIITDNFISGHLKPITGPRDVNCTFKCKLTEEGQRLFRESRQRLMEQKSMTVNQLLGKSRE